jgi:hypothetical protein
MNALEQEATDIALIREETYLDPVYFCQFFFPEVFTLEIPWFHRGILAILTKKTKFLWTYGEVWKLCKYFVARDAEENVTATIFQVEDASGSRLSWEEVKVREDNGSVGDLVIVLCLGKHTLLVLPRGFSKTTYAGKVAPIYDIVFQEVPFFLYVSESGTHAEMQVNNIRNELKDNARIKYVFGELMPTRSEELKDSERLFETRTGNAMAARGRGAQVRGMLHKDKRPKKIIWDDLEDKDVVATEAQRIKSREWFFGNLLPCLPRLDKEASSIGMGTMLDEDCLLAHLMKDDEWTVVKFGAELDDGEMLWEAQFTKAELEKEKAAYAAKGLLHVFYLEYLNIVRNPDTQVFTRKMFRYGMPEGENIVATAIYCDPAFTEKKKGDWAVILVASMTDRGTIVVRNYWQDRGQLNMTRTIIDKFFELQERYGTQQQGVEAAAQQKSLIHTMREEMFRKKRYFEIIPVANAVSKNARILGIVSPRMSSLYVSFEVPFPELEAQLLDWDRNKKEQVDDGPDGLAGVISLLDPFASAGMGHPEQYDEEKEEELHVMLEKELNIPAVPEGEDGDWRMI